jgi:2,5-diamino-6-(ribosylamino)-4(3H)-pyrimidinone 5'-phosphate reductase
MRPKVIVNCAMSPDGKIATKERKQVRISSEEDMRRVRQLRLECDAILVGVGTIVADDPHLTVKNEPRDAQPLRVVLDPNGRTPDGAKVLNDHAPTLIVTLENCTKEFSGQSVLRTGENAIDLERLMEELERRGISSVLVEGGGVTIWSLFSAGLVDEYRVYVGTRIIGGGTAPSPVDGAGFLENDSIGLVLRCVERMGEGVLLTYEVRRDG